MNDTQPATDGFMDDVREDGEVVGKLHCWPIEDQDKCLVLIEDDFGDLAAYIEDAPEDED